MLYAFVQKQRASNSPHELNITYFIGGRCVADEDTVSYLKKMFKVGFRTKANLDNTFN